MVISHYVNLYSFLRFHFTLILPQICTTDRTRDAMDNQANSSFGHSQIDALVPVCHTAQIPDKADAKKS